MILNLIFFLIFSFDIFLILTPLKMTSPYHSLATPSPYIFDCNICFSFPEEPITTPCGHIFCWKCYYIAAPNKDKIKCYVCRSELFFHEIASLKVFSYKERSNFLLLEGYNIPPRPYSLLCYNERRNKHSTGIRMGRNGSIDAKIVVTRNMVSMLMCLFLMACIGLYGLKNFLLET